MSVITKYTRLIRLSDRKYPVYLNSVRQEFPGVSIPENPTRTQLLAYGYGEVVEHPKPEGEKVYELDPAENHDGSWSQYWMVDVHDHEEKKNLLRLAKDTVGPQVNRVRERELAEGFTYEFPNGMINRIQLRINTNDQSTLLAFQMEAQTMIALGLEGTITFRTYEDINHVLTPRQLLDMTYTILAKVKKLYATSWAIKEYIDMVGRVEDIPDIEGGLLVIDFKPSLGHLISIAVLDSFEE